VSSGRPAAGSSPVTRAMATVSATSRSRAAALKSEVYELAVRRPTKTRMPSALLPEFLSVSTSPLRTVTEKSVPLATTTSASVALPSRAFRNRSWARSRCSTLVLGPLQRIHSDTPHAVWRPRAKLGAMESAASASSGFAGHPRGLRTLFFTEMWERFSYYGMRAFLILYLVAPATSGGLGFSAADAASVYGTYTGSAWGAAILGGLVADRVLGQFNAVLVGGIIIAMGHFSMAVPTLATFYGGLTLIVIGTGLLKPNISAMVGGLYSQDDPRRDSGFSLFYSGINLGAFFAPIVCGFLA